MVKYSFTSFLPNLGQPTKTYPAQKIGLTHQHRPAQKWTYPPKLTLILQWTDPNNKLTLPTIFYQDFFIYVIFFSH